MQTRAVIQLCKTTQVLKYRSWSTYDTYEQRGARTKRVIIAGVAEYLLLNSSKNHTFRVQSHTCYMHRETCVGHKTTIPFTVIRYVQAGLRYAYFKMLHEDSSNSSRGPIFAEHIPC